MTVSELKKALRNVPDDFPVTLILGHPEEKVCGREIASASTLQLGEDWELFALMPKNEVLHIDSGYLAALRALNLAILA